MKSTGKRTGNASSVEQKITVNIEDALTIID